MTAPVPTVTHVVKQIKGLLEGNFRHLSVVGEVSNLSHSATGHWYFTLADQESALSAALFKMDALRNPLVRGLKDGDKVICSGSIGVYSKRGTFQIIVKHISPAGKGDLKEQLEKLKKKLAAEGLFDLEAKLPIPEFPKRVGVVTAPKSAAIQDFLNIFKRRSLWMDIVVSPALVQGQEAPASLVKAMQKLIKYSLNASEEKKLDAIVLTRGGGSLEDLWAFNDEALAWEIFNCPIPVISAVGHEIDFSISDYVADMRCETPSAAAEVLTRGQVAIADRMKINGKHLKHFSELVLVPAHRRLGDASPAVISDLLWNRYVGYQKRLNKLDIRPRLLELTGMHEKTYQLEDALKGLMRSSEKILKDRSTALTQSWQMINALGPDKVLKRGYTYVKDENGNLVAGKKQFEKIAPEGKMTIHFHDGQGQIKKTGNVHD